MNGYKKLWDAYGEMEMYGVGQYVPGSITKLEDVVTKQSEIRANNLTRIKQYWRTTIPRKVCNAGKFDPITNDCMLDSKENDENEYFYYTDSKGNRIAYDVILDTDQDGQTVNKWIRPDENGVMSISDCFGKIEKDKDKGAIGIVYYNTKIGNDKRGTCFTIKNRFKEGTSSGVYKREGSIVVAKKKTGFY